MDAWQLANWEAYRDVARLGRKTRLSEEHRGILWSIYKRVRQGLRERQLVTHAGMFTALAAAVVKSANPPFDFAVVDEAQDISVAHLRFFAPGQFLLAWHGKDQFFIWALPHQISLCDWAVPSIAAFGFESQRGAESGLSTTKP